MSSNTSSLRVLVVEDDADLLDIVCSQVAEQGFTPIAASSADEGMKILRENLITAVLSDISMPGGTGLDLLKRAQVFGITPPFAFVTGFGSSQNLLEAVRLGATDFLFKPFDLVELRGVLQRIVAIGEKQRQIDDFLDDLGSTVAPQAREAIDTIRREISLLRVAGKLAHQ